MRDQTEKEEAKPRDTVETFSGLGTISNWSWSNNRFRGGQDRIKQDQTGVEQRDIEKQCCIDYITLL